MYNLENVSKFEIEQQLHEIFDRWKTYNIYKVDILLVTIVATVYCLEVGVGVGVGDIIFQ